MAFRPIDAEEAARREDEMTESYAGSAAVFLVQGFAMGLHGESLRTYVLDQVEGVRRASCEATTNNMAAKGRRPPDWFLEAANQIMDRAVARAVDQVMAQVAP